MSVYDTLLERGYIAQTTHEDEIRELLEKEKISFYIGFDPTADSLHVGHFLGMMVMAHMQREGHRPICLIGGGTGFVGDPSGKTDMRRMMTPDEIQHNCDCFKKQMERFIDFSDGKAIMVNNADWLLNLNYIDFLRNYGVHFSVNRMLTAECFRNRLERGLSFFEFNYMIMQSYDFLELHNRYDCVMEMGGDDQWSNIIGGVELIRRKESKPAFGMTYTLLTTSDGRKMGKTEKGALWLDPEKTSPYEFYQYWRNINDADVKRCLALLTFLPMEEVNRLGDLKDQAINEAKKILAYEVTKMVHGEEEAQKAQSAAEALFGGKGVLDNAPTVTLTEEAFGQKVIDVLTEAKIFASKSEGRRLMQQNGLTLGDSKVTDIETVLTEDMFADRSLLVRKGKKNYFRLVY